MLRLGTLLAFALIASGQIPERPAFISIDATATGELHGSLTAPINPMPAWLPIAFAHAIGCGIGAQEQTSYATRIEAQCRMARPSALTFRAAINLGELGPVLRQAGFSRLDLILHVPSTRSLRIEPAIPPQTSAFNSYYRAEYSLDQLPPRITIDGGFEASRIRSLAVAALALILSPFLLLALRRSDLLRLHVQAEGLFVFGWICWIFVLLRLDAGPLLSFLFARSVIGPLLCLMAPPMAAVWIGSRLAANEYARLAPNGLGAEYYRRLRFWYGATAVSVASALLNALLCPFTNGLVSLVTGIGLAILCVLAMRRISRGGSHQLADGDLRRRMFALAAKGGVKLRGVSIMTAPTPRPPAAFATRWGVILMNDALLANLSRREVDAIVCHELSHLRPARRSAMVGIYVVLVASILGSQWIPGFTNIIPVSLFVIYFLIKAWRRGGERQADLDSVRWSGDPEAMITGLARVSNASGMPIEWGAPISWMMGHPSTMDRIHAIARAGGLAQSRVAELMDESKREAADHYVDSQPSSVPEDAAFSPALRRSLQTRLTWYALLSPAAFGLPAVWLLERMGLEWWMVIIAGTLLSMLAIYIGSEWIVGAVRSAAKQRAVARHGQGVYAGLSPSAEPRLFDGAYQYDLGIVRFGKDGLEFAGDLVHFTLDSRSVQRIWLGDGPRHWTARKVVYIETGSMIFSLQSFEAWFWPSTVAAAKRLHRQIEEWHQAPFPSPAPPLPCPVPQVQGNPDTNISLRTAVRSIGIYSGVAVLLTSIKTSLEISRGPWDPFEVLRAPVVCGILALFLVWPRLDWGRIKNLPKAQPSLPADS